MAQRDGEGRAEEKPYDIKERTFQFALDIVRFCRSPETRHGTARTLSRQLLRAGTSIGANVEEAHAGQSRADFVSKEAIALKEARETIYWLRLVTAAELAPGENCRRLLQEARELASILGAIVVNTKSHGTS